MKKEISGFTLIEIVIALAVLIVGLVGTIVVIPMGQAASREASVITEATLVATEKLAEIKAYGYDRVALDPPPFSLSGQKDAYKWEVEIKDVLDSDFTDLVMLPIQNLKRISVTVEYSLKQRVKRDTFHSFLAQF